MVVNNNNGIKKTSQKIIDLKEEIAEINFYNDFLSEKQKEKINSLYEQIEKLQKRCFKGWYVQILTEYNSYNNNCITTSVFNQDLKLLFKTKKAAIAYYKSNLSQMIKNSSDTYIQGVSFIRV